MKKKLFPIALFLFVFLLLSLPYLYGIFNVWQEKMVDRFFLVQKPSQNIIIIGIDDQSISAIGQWPWQRRVFGDILPDLKTAQIIGFDINFADPSSKGDKDDAYLADSLKNSSVPIIFPIELRNDNVISVKPLDPFTTFVSLGYANIPIDQDGVSRKIVNHRGQYTSFSALFSRKDVFVPQENRIGYKGPAKTFLTIPFIDVYQHKIPSRIFDGAIVLIGATANNLHDFLDTPFGIMPGVEVNANAVETLLEGKFIKEIPMGAGLALLFILNLLVSLSIAKIRRFVILLSSLMLILVFIIFLAFGLFYFHIIFPILYALIGFTLTLVTMLSYHYVIESKEKRFIRNSFQHYLSGDVIEQLVNHPEKLRLGGERRKVSILFSDMRDFTSISESMTPEELTIFMSEYFTGISDIVMDKRGVIDKYIGDAIMAFWGAPLDNPRHAEDACRTALSIKKKLEEHNKISVAKGKPVINIGVGINTGEVVVGNMGSLKRFNYTIIGDDVNFTSRLEGLNKEYGTSCIISESTKEEIKDVLDLHARELDEVLVKGKSKPKRIFELMEKPKDKATEESLRAFEEGRKLYISGEWERAIKMFEKATAFGDGKTSRIFIERCRNLLAEPPSVWSGIYQFKNK